MAIVILLLILIIEFSFSYVLSGKDILSPSVIFSFVFMCAVIDLITMIDVWSVNLHLNTIFVIASGVFVFTIVTAFCQSVRFSVKHRLKKKAASISSKNIQSWKIKTLLLLNIFSILYVAYKVVAVVRGVGYNGSALSCIGRYSHLSKFTTQSLNIGRIASNIHQLCEAQSYMWGFILVDEWFGKKKISIYIVLNFIITTLSWFLYGSRTGGVFVIISLIPIFLIKYRAVSGKKSLKAKYILAGLSIVFILMMSFQKMGAVMSRTLDDTTMWEYISIYLGAPVLNLDSFLQEMYSKTPIWGYNTFATQINYIGAKIGMMKYNIELPFRSINGRNLGNVYTTFYAYIRDFGYAGMLILTSVMAIVVQILYKKASKHIKNNSRVNVVVLTYMYVIPAVVFSFFSNKFYEGFSIFFVKALIYWTILPYFLYQVKVTLRK